MSETPTDELGSVTAEMDHLLYALRDLDTLVRYRALPGWSGEWLMTRYGSRYAELHARWLVLTGGTAPAAAAAPAWAPPPPAWTPQPFAPPPPPPPPSAPPVPPFSLRRLVEENTIAVLSYAGGFLLAIAVLLFELYGADTFGDGVRFAAILGLDCAFGIAARVCWTRPRLRVVGRTYTAVFAVLTPLTFLAAYVLVLRPNTDVTPATAFTLGAAVCTLLYGGLARAIGSREYAWLCGAGLVATFAGAVSAAASDHLWDGAVVATAVPLFATVRLLAPRLREWEVFAAPAHFWQTVGAPATAITMTLIATGHDPAWQQTEGVRLLYVPVTIGIISATLLVTGGLRRIDAETAVGALLASVAGVFLTQSLRLDATGAAGALLVAAAVLVALRRLRPSADLEALRRTGIAVHILGAALLPFPDTTTQAVVLVCAVVVAAAEALTAGQPLWLLVGPGALLAQAAVGQLPLDALLTTAPPRLVTLTVTLAATSAGLTALVATRRRAAWAAPLAASLMATGLAFNHSVLGDASGAAALLLAGAAACAGVAERLAGGPRDALLTLGVSAAAVAALLPQAGAGGQALAAVIALALIVLVAVRHGSAAAGVVAGGALLWAWFWTARVIGMVPAVPSAGDLALLYSPLPPLAAAVLFIVAGATGAAPPRGLRRGVEIGAAAVAAGVALLALADGRLGLLGIDLLIDAALLHAVAVVEDEPGVAWAGPMLAALGAVSLLANAGAASTAYPVAGTFVGILAYLAGAGEPGERRGRALRESALGVLAVSAAGSAAAPQLWEAHTAGPLAGLVSGLGLCAVLALDGAMRSRWSRCWAALGLAGFALDWIPVDLAATDAQAFVVLPGLALLATGLGTLEHRASGVTADASRMLVGAGALLLLGTTSLQGLGDATTGTGYVALLVVESALAMVLAGLFRNRTLAGAAGAGLLVAALRSLLIAVQTFPLYAVFAAVAVILLGLATFLAVARGPVHELRELGTRSWERWR